MFIGFFIDLLKLACFTCVAFSTRTSPIFVHFWFRLGLSLRGSVVNRPLPGRRIPLQFYVAVRNWSFDYIMLKFVIKFVLSVYAHLQRHRLVIRHHINCRHDYFWIFFLVVAMFTWVWFYYFISRPRPNGLYILYVIAVWAIYVNFHSLESMTIYPGAIQWRVRPTKFNVVDNLSLLLIQIRPIHRRYFCDRNGELAASATADEPTDSFESSFEALD